MNQTRLKKTIKTQKKPQNRVGFTTSRKRLPPKQFNPALITHTQPKQLSIKGLMQLQPNPNTTTYLYWLGLLHIAIDQEIERLEEQIKCQENNHTTPQTNN
jgi:hypothetical protein